MCGADREDVYTYKHLGRPEDSAGRETQRMSAQRMDHKKGNTAALDADGRRAWRLGMVGDCVLLYTICHKCIRIRDNHAHGSHLVSFRGKRHKYGAHGPAGWWYS
jgi:hypothetical protein